jgi:hypothetical protein
MCFPPNTPSRSIFGGVSCGMNPGAKCRPTHRTIATTGPCCTSADC